LVHDTDKNPPKTEDKNKSKRQSVKADDIVIAIRMLRTYMNPQDIDPLISALETLKTDPQNAEYQAQVTTTFNNLGIMQGAALTYAPFLNVYVSDDPFADR
jgi:hypothetical protein